MLRSVGWQVVTGLSSYTVCPSKMEEIDCHETLVTIYQRLLINISEERRLQLHRVRGLKSHTKYLVQIHA